MGRHVGLGRLELDEVSRPLEVGVPPQRALHLRAHLRAEVERWVTATDGMRRARAARAGAALRGGRRGRTGGAAPAEAGRRACRAGWPSTMYGAKGGMLFFVFTMSSSACAVARCEASIRRALACRRSAKSTSRTMLLLRRRRLPLLQSCCLTRGAVCGAACGSNGETAQQV